ncbi:ankyrin protein [Fusarium sp. NRRL 25303]|nr:ankyrin protein [Fusarium sp. NRRL 25303]
MASSLSLVAASPYREFTERPINRYNYHGPPFDVPVTITDRDGTLIHEQEGQGLLYAIITHNDVEFLEKYFAIDPRAIPNLSDLPDDDEAICDFGELFRAAAESGSLGTLQTLLDYTTKDLHNAAKPIRLIRANFQLLNIAAQFGRIEIVQWLLDTQPLYASIHDRDLRGFTALAAAADLFSFNSFSYPAYDELPSVLTLAAQWDSTDLLERLIDGGADVHYKEAVIPRQLKIQSPNELPVKIEITALFLASFRANPSGIKTLVDRRGDGVTIADMICSPDCVGSLPLHWAARNQLPHSPRLMPATILHETAGQITRTIEQLLDFAPTTVNIQDSFGNTALHYATRYFGKNGTMYNSVFELLYSRGADASLRNHKGETPLHTLFKPNKPYKDAAPIDPVTISLLLAHGAKTTDVDKTGNSPLHVACSSVKFGGDTISVLLQHGADPGLRNFEQDTPIHRVAGFYCVRDGLSSEADGIMRAQDAILERIVKNAISLPGSPCRYEGSHNAGFVTNPSRHPTRASFTELTDYFVQWLVSLVKKDDNPELKDAFENGTISSNVSRIEDLYTQIATPQQLVIGPQVPDQGPDNDPKIDARLLLRNLNYELEPECLGNKSTWWFRTYEGHCNWLKKGEAGEGAVGSARPRDYQQHTYADGISKPREGPNPRAVSNAFFKRKMKICYDHTPLLLGLIEFIIHDVTYSQDSANEFIGVPMPEDEEIFPLNTTLRVPRTASMPGTGTSRSNPRENMNMATTWLDISSLYGSNIDVAHRLRSKVDGKLLTQEVQPPGTRAKASYLPFNTIGVPTNTRPGVKPEELFAGGDPRTNEDWLVLGIHTLLLREHNRLCNILRKQKLTWDDEQLYQTVRVVMSVKHASIANAYQMAYWTDEMPWPRDDGFPLYRQMFGENALEINPANTYPWPLVTKNGKPMTVSAEMAVVYRFHEFIIPSFLIKDQNNATLWEQNLFDTSFNSTGFLDVGLERIIAGALSSHIPNFKSGVDESFRSAGLYRGRPFDIVVSSIVHEREQGLPTFNQYFREYNAQEPEVSVPIRDTWDKFSADPEVIQNLKTLYKHPDDVDLFVGCQLYEEWFPGTTVPKSALIISLFSLFGMGNSDRFSIGFAMMRCLLVDRPWDCHPSNTLEDLIWEQKDVPGFPNFRFYSDFWVKELDLPAHEIAFVSAR